MSSKNLKEIADKARKNDFISISELMTGIENRVFSRKEVSQLIFKESHKSLKIGITGPPGAGKSSLMNKLIPQIRKENLSVGVIAIDPSSPITGGSFLGDRVRINNAVNDDNVFVRSMGSRAELGGVTELAEDFSDILAFSGKDIIFIETVGVGQSEYSVSEITDLTTLVFVPESGDEIQLLKAGILELADVFVVNKSDRKDSNLLVKSINNILSSTKKDSKKIPIFKTSCKTDEGIEDFSQAITSYFKSMKDNKDIQEKQVLRYNRRIKSIVEKDILSQFWHEERTALLDGVDKASIKTKSPYELVDEIKEKMNNNDMSIVDHLEELRWRILKSLGSILLMSVLTFNFANFLVDILIKPASQINSDLNLQVLTIQGMFLLKWNLAIIGGIILSLPVITVQVWKFLSPGLYDKEKKILVPLILTAFICFILGGVFAYKVILPFSLDFFASMITADIQNNFSINYYFSFVLSLMIGAGLIFELPVASFLFSSIGLINPEFLKTYRREAIAITVVLSAIITPPDPISLIIMSIPMLILYEISIVVSWFANKLFNNET